VTSQEERLLAQQDGIHDQESSCNQAMKAVTAALNQPVSEADLKKLSPKSLAYLGDAVYELYVRMIFLLPPCRVDSYHNLVVAQVRAERQALHLRSLIPHLVTSELEIVRRGRNAVTGKPKRLEPETYQQATSFETLIGYLFLTDETRLTELLRKLNLESR
jgi:ribonuclease III family protein